MFVPEMLLRRNDALDSNPPDAAVHISTNASNWLWAAFSLVTLCLLIMVGFTFMVSSVALPRWYDADANAEAKRQTSVPPDRRHGPLHHHDLVLLHGL